MLEFKQYISMKYFNILCYKYSLRENFFSLNDAKKKKKV